MRIAQFIHTLHMGGAERLAVDLAIRLQRRGHQAAVVCLADTGELEPELRSAGIQTLVLNKTAGLDVKPLLAMQQFFRRGNFDVVHSHNTHLHHHGALAARLARVPVLVNTVHGLVNVPQGSRAKVLYQACAFTTDKITTVCTPVSKALTDGLKIPARQVEIVHNGIAPEKFLSIGERPSNGEVVFGTIGRFVPVKNHEGLIRAFAHVHRIRPATRLRLMGYGPLEARLREIVVELRLGSAVDFIDGTSDGAKFLETLDVFVMSSRSEGMPMSLLEAMAAGRPVIGPTVGGIPEVIEGGHCGWLAPDVDPEPFSKVLLQAVDTEDRAELGRKARQHVLDHFTLEGMTGNYEQLFERLLMSRDGEKAAA